MAIGINRLNWAGWTKMASISQQVFAFSRDLYMDSKGFQEDKNKSFRPLEA